MSTNIKAFSNNVYLFAPDLNGSVVASRAEKFIVGGLFGNHVSKIDEDFIMSNLHNFVRTPLLVILDGLPTIISTATYPSSGLCLAVSIKVSLRAVLSVIGEGNVLISTSYNGISPAERISQEKRNIIIEMLNTVLLLNDSISVLRGGGIYNAASLSALRARLIFDFIGCELKVNPLFPFGEVGDYDLSLFTAFIICAATFVRRATITHSAELSFHKTSTGLTASISASVDSKPDTFEFDFLRKQFEQMNVYFCTNLQGDTLKIEICPQRPDYSKLGLKDKPKFPQ